MKVRPLLPACPVCLNALEGKVYVEAVNDYHKHLDRRSDGEYEF